MKFDVGALTIVAGVVIPLATAVVTKQLASSRLKSLVTVTLAAVAGLVQTAIDGGGVVSRETVTNALMAWVLAISSYYGLWKPTQTAGTVGAATARFGIGRDEGPGAERDADDNRAPGSCGHCEQ